MSKLDLSLFDAMPGFARLCRALEADRGQTRLVGGAVRDSLLRHGVEDVDLATRLSPTEVLARLAAADIRAVPTGLAHGTITAISGGTPYEVTTLRRDVRSFGRHAEIAFTDDWREDAARRDFTINALYADPLTGELFDYFGGLDDLSRHHVRFIGDPLQRIAEDHLRILRFFRFTARFGAAADAEALAACAARANDLMALSRERIRDELLKLLALPDPAPTLAEMLKRSILEPVLPEIPASAIQPLQRLVAAEQKATVAADALRRLMALLPRNTETANAIAARLKLSNTARRRLMAVANSDPVPSDPRALAYRIGGAATLDRMLLDEDPRTPSWAGQLQAYQPPRMPVSGRDLIAMGLVPGPEVSRRLAEVEQAWIDRGFPAARETVMAIARTVVGLR